MFCAGTLVEDGYVVDTAYDGVEGEDLALITSYSLIILDVMLPKQRWDRSLQIPHDQHVATPILMLTARTRSTTALPAWIAVQTIISSSRLKSRNYTPVCVPCSAAKSDNKSGSLQVADLKLDPATHFAIAAEAPLGPHCPRIFPARISHTEI